MESGGFQFNNEEMKKIVDKMVRSRYTFDRVFFGKVSQEQILDEIHKQELILKGLRKNIIIFYLNFNIMIILYIIYYIRNSIKMNILTKENLYTKCIIQWKYI